MKRIKKKKKSDFHQIYDIFTKNIFTYFNGIFFILALLLINTGSFQSLVFLPVVIINMVIAIYQQLKSKRVLDKLTLLSTAKYSILRDEVIMECPTDKLCVNDIIYLESGHQIPADAVVVEGNISANEALLTGESDEIDKRSGSLLMSGSFIVSGKCSARLTAVGEDSYIEKLSTEAKQSKIHVSGMVNDVNKIVKVTGILIIPVGILLLYQALAVNNLSYKIAIESMVGAVIGMIPEGLYLLVTLTLALSATKLAGKKVLLHDMKSIEMLSRVDVLCVDKTGTITSNEMDVTSIFASSDLKETDINQARCQLASYIATITDSNITAKALRSYLPIGEVFETESMTPFTSKLKYSEIKTVRETYRLGAPDILIAEKDLAKNKTGIEVHVNKGERVLVFAQKEGETFKPLLYISFSNSLRPKVSETFAYLISQGVAILVISGDNPKTVSKIATTVSIPGAENYVDATTLQTEAAIDEAVKKYTVFGRVAPDQKREIVKALKKSGLKVAMTGDGVNDILAMKEADCSIALGGGSDAAMQSAQVVLLDSDFSHMEEIIDEGRRNVNNITRSATLFLYKNIFSMCLSLFAIIFAYSYPLKPSQISLVSMFNIGIPAFALALEANTAKQHNDFFRTVFEKSVPASLTSFLTIALLVTFGKLFEIDSHDIATASTVLLSAAGFMLMVRISKPLNGYRKFILISCIAGFILFANVFSKLFSINDISYPSFLLVIVFIIAQESLMRNLSIIVEKIASKYKKVQ